MVSLCGVDLGRSVFILVPRSGLFVLFDLSGLLELPSTRPRFVFVFLTSSSGLEPLLSRLRLSFGLIVPFVIFDLSRYPSEPPTTAPPYLAP